MEPPNQSKLLPFLIGYYGMLQAFHSLLLIRAGWFLLQNREIPFPAPPPPGGWAETALPFLLGMGLVDLFAIGLGLVFVYRSLFQKEIRYTIGLVSLTAALSSGIVYLVGTLPSGAWEANPIAYLAVLVLFSPILPLYYFLLKQR
jgi:hypothetical protein